MALCHHAELVVVAPVGVVLGPVGEAGVHDGEGARPKVRGAVGADVEG